MLEMRVTGASRYTRQLVIAIYVDYKAYLLNYFLFFFSLSIHP